MAVDLQSGAGPADPAVEIAAELGIPRIDLSPALRQLQQAPSAPASEEFVQLAASVAGIMEAGSLGGLGMFIAIGHGVPQDVMDAVDGATAEYFGLSAEEKLRLKVGDGSWLGYSSFERMIDSAADPSDGKMHAAADSKEFFNAVLGAAAHPEDAAACRWPEHPAAFRSAWEAYYRCMESVAQALYWTFAAALGLPRDFFDRFCARHQSQLKGLNYGPADSVRAGDVRCAAHTDWVPLTILRQLNDAEGGCDLEVEARSAAAAAAGPRWVPVRSSADELVVNAGDMMRQWTNGAWKSVRHRVVQAVPRVVATPGRMSLVYFACLSKDAVVDPRDVITGFGGDPAPDDAGSLAPPVTFWEYVTRRMSQVHEEEFDQ